MGAKDFSTLEVNNDYHALHQGKYPEVVQHADSPEVYYDPAIAAQVVMAAPGTPSAHSYSTYPEVLATPPPPLPPSGAAPIREKQATVCGIRRRTFWISLVVVSVLIIAVVVGAAVGAVRGNMVGSKAKGEGESTNSNGGDGDANGAAGGLPRLSLYEDTQLASANFTDTFGNQNILLIYQLSDASIGMSAFNSSTNKWVVSTIVNGTVSGVKLGTSLALNTNWEDSSAPDVSIYFQDSGPVATIRSMIYSSSDNLPTTTPISANKWTPYDAASTYASIPGSALVSYGRQCEWCNQFAYFIYQGPKTLFLGQLEGDTVAMEVIDVTVTPSTNTSISLTYSGTLNGDEDAILRRSLNLFYRSTTSGLTQLRIGNGAYLPRYVGRDIGPQTNFAAFTTGFNESYARNPTPLGFQVLSIDPDAGDGVQLTYFKDGEWTAASEEVEELAECQGRATMAVNTARRVYCVVESGTDGGVEIVEWAWQGDPSDVSTYMSWDRIGAVDVGVGKNGLGLV